MVRDLDAILVGSKDEDEFIDLLEDFLGLCQENWVHINPTKFQIAGPRESLIFAGIHVSDKCFTVDLSPLQAIREFPDKKSEKPYDE